jgi:hypothetical protein
MKKVIKSGLEPGKVTPFDLTIKPLKVIGIHKQSHEPVLILNCSLEETAINKQKEILEENNNFFVEFEKFQLSLQPLSYREAKLDDPQEYGKYIDKSNKEATEKVKKYVEENSPKFIDFNIYVI